MNFHFIRFTPCNSIIKIIYFFNIRYVTIMSVDRCIICYKSEEQWSKWSGKSLIYIRNNVGPNIDPCGTPESTSENSVSPFSLSMACWRWLKYELNHWFRWRTKFIQGIFFWIKMEWSTRSKAFRKSRNRAPTISPLSIHSIQLSTRLVRKLLRRSPFYQNNWTSFKTAYIVIKCYIYGVLGWIISLLPLMVMIQ